MLTFSHGGNLGDILFSLYFCTELAYSQRQAKYNFHIQTNVKDPFFFARKHPYGDVRMTTAAAEFLKPLLLVQPYINSVTYGDNIPDGCINLDRFRDLALNLSAGDNRHWYYNLTPVHLPREFWKSVLLVPETDRKFEGKILFSQTERYQNVTVDFSQLKRFADALVFVGTREEHERFCKICFPMEYCPVNNIYELAKYLNGARGFCAGQSGLFSLAECMKVPRILVAPEFTRFNNRIIPGPHNVHPLGGWCEDVSSTEKLMAAMTALLSKA